jgi:hypothetical protein
MREVAGSRQRCRRVVVFRVRSGLGGRQLFGVLGVFGEQRLLLLIMGAKSAVTDRSA